MDVLLVFMVFATLVPFFFARRKRWFLVVLQSALALGMWDYFLSHFTTITVLNAPTSVIAFYGSLLITNIAIIYIMISYFKQLERSRRVPFLRSEVNNNSK